MKHLLMRIEAAYLGWKMQRLVRDIAWARRDVRRHINEVRREIMRVEQRLMRLSFKRQTDKKGD